MWDLASRLPHLLLSGTLHQEGVSRKHRTRIEGSALSSLLLALPCIFMLAELLVPIPQLGVFCSFPNNHKPTPGSTPSQSVALLRVHHQHQGDPLWAQRHQHWLPIPPPSICATVRMSLSIYVLVIPASFSCSYGPKDVVSASWHSTSWHNTLVSYLCPFHLHYRVNHSFYVVVFVRGTSLHFVSWLNNDW